MNAPRWSLGHFVMAIAVGALAMLVWQSASPQVPVNALRYQRELMREALYTWGNDAPIATFAAQVQQESAWRPGAMSAVGAQGIAQFMPATARWLAEAYPALAAPAPTDPEWALRALVTYDRHLWERVSAVDRCNHMAKTLSSYNGGLAWIARDEAKARSLGFDPAFWWASVELVNSGRSQAAWRENRGYPRRILRTLEATYVNAGWSGGACSPG